MVLKSQFTTRCSSSTGLSALVLTRILGKEIHKDQVQKQQQSDEQKQIQNVYLIVGGVLTCLGW